MIISSGSLDPLIAEAHPDPALAIAELLGVLMAICSRVDDKPELEKIAWHLVDTAKRIDADVLLGQRMH